MDRRAFLYARVITAALSRSSTALVQCLVPTPKTMGTLKRVDPRLHLRRGIDMSLSAKSTESAVGLNSISVSGVCTPVSNPVDAGEEPVFAFYMVLHVEGKVTIGGVNSAHHEANSAYANVESTSYWHVDGLKLNDAAVDAKP